MKVSFSENRHTTTTIESRRNFLSGLGLGAVSFGLGSHSLAEDKLPAAHVNDMELSERGVNLIKSFESLKLQAYQCQAGVWTIGYGHTRTAKEGMKLSGEEDAVQLLRRDIEDHRQEVLKLFNSKKILLSQAQFDALTSAVFNVNCLKGGSSGFARFLLRKIPELAHAEIDERIAICKEITEYLCRYNRAGGKALDGLTRRRLSEGLLFAEAGDPLVTLKEFNLLKAEVKKLKPTERAGAIIDRVFAKRGLC